MFGSRQKKKADVYVLYRYKCKTRRTKRATKLQNRQGNMPSEIISSRDEYIIVQQASEKGV